MLLNDDEHERAFSAALRMRGHLRRFELLAQSQIDRPNMGTDLLEISNKILDCALDISKQTARFERAAQHSSGRIFRKV